MSTTQPIQPASDALLAEVKEAAVQAVLQNEPATLPAVDVLAITTRLEYAEIKVTDLENDLKASEEEVREAKREQDDAEEERDDMKKELYALEKEHAPNGMLVLKITSLGHAPDLLAAEKIEAWLNTVGLMEAAELLPLDQTPATAGPNQLPIPYPHAA